MTVDLMTFSGRGGEKSPMFALDMDLDAALAVYCEQRWPVGRRKSVIAEWDLNVEEARSVIEGKASKRTIGKILKHKKRGGWRVALPLIAAVVGESIHDHFRHQMREAAREQRLAEEHERLAATAYRRLADDLLLPGGAAGRRDPENRKSRRSA